jgi:VPDSG-CTERM motif
MNKLKYLGAVLIAVAGLGLQQAQAHLLDPQQFTTQGPIGNPQAERDFLVDNGFMDDCCQFISKFEGAGSNVFFNITVVNANTWNISWNFGATGLTFCGALIKDGNVQGEGHLYRFYGVSADELTAGSGTVTFDNPVRGISHISLFACTEGRVPDGGTTLMLLGAALGSLGMARRFLKK